MATAHEKYLRLEALKREFKAEALELTAIAQAAGDSRTDAIKWAAADTRVVKLFDEIESAGGFAD